MADKKHHKFTHTHIEHHPDHSATIHHVHEEGPHKDVKHAVPSLDHVHDSLQDHLGAPLSESTEALEKGDHGIPPAVAGPAGIPPAPTAGA